LKQQLAQKDHKLHQKDQAVASYKQQRAAIEERLYEKITFANDDRQFWKEKAKELKESLEASERANESLKKRVIQLTNEHASIGAAPSPRDQEYRKEIEELQNLVAIRQLDFEEEKKRGQDKYSQLSQELKRCSEDNRKLARVANDFERRLLAKEDAPQPDGVRSLMDVRAGEITAVKEKLHNKESEYRSLEDSFRMLQRAKRQQEEEFRERERLFNSTSQAHSTLLEDTLSIDSRRVRTRWEADMPGDSGRISPESYATTGGSSSRPDTIAEAGGPTGPHLVSIPMVENMSTSTIATMRPTGASSPVEHYNPFAANLPRRPTGPTGKSGNKINAKSEIRIYGRYVSLVISADLSRGGAQNMGMKAKKKDKAEA
jgi:hypothetical protein